MLDEALSRHVDVRKLAKKGSVYTCKMPVLSLPRVAEAVTENSSEADVQLEFGRDEEGRYIITGTVSAVVGLPCQRCLESMEVALDATVNLAIVWDDAQARALPKTIDPLIAGEEPVDLVSIVEDELLLVMPFVTYHDEADCQGVKGYTPEPEPEPQTEQAERENPFKVLEQLKSK